MDEQTHNGTKWIIYLPRDDTVDDEWAYDMDYDPKHDLLKLTLLPLDNTPIRLNINGINCTINKATIKAKIITLKELEIKTNKNKQEFLNFLFNF